MYPYNSQLKPTGLLPSVQVYMSATRFPFFRWSNIIHHQHPQHPVVVFHQPIWKMLARQIGSFQTWNPNFAGWKFKKKTLKKHLFIITNPHDFCRPRNPSSITTGSAAAWSGICCCQSWGGTHGKSPGKTLRQWPEPKNVSCNFLGFRGFFFGIPKILSHHGNPKQKLCISYYFLWQGNTSTRTTNMYIKIQNPPSPRQWLET